MRDDDTTITVTTETANTLVRALRSGIPKLVLFGGTAAEATLTWKARGETIDDPECEETFEALENGVYLRCRVERHECPTAFRWMFLCKSDDLHDVIVNWGSQLTETDVRAIGPDSAFQIHSWREATRRAAARNRWRSSDTAAVSEEPVEAD